MKQHRKQKRRKIRAGGSIPRRGQIFFLVAFVRGGRALRLGFEKRRFRADGSEVHIAVKTAYRGSLHETEYKSTLRQDELARLSLSTWSLYSQKRCGTILQNRCLDAS